MTCCDRALKVLAQLEHPRPVGMSSQDYQDWLQQLSDIKFTYLVAAQVCENAFEQWTASAFRAASCFDPV